MKYAKYLPLVGLLVIALLVVEKKQAEADSFHVAITTVIPNNVANGAAAFTAAGYPNYTGNLRVRKVWISNDGPDARVQMWNNCTSSTTASLVWDGVVSTSSVKPGNLDMDLLPRSMTLANPCIHKSAGATGTVRGTIFYE